MYQVIEWTPLANLAWTLGRVSAAVAIVAVLAAAAAGLVLWRWPAVRFGRWAPAMVVVVVGLVGYFFQLRIRHSLNDSVMIARNFFAVVHVTEDRSVIGLPVARELQHGNILHGLQLVEGISRRLPTAYYSTSSGVGRAVRSVQADARPGFAGTTRRRHWGMVGMGVGTMAAYAPAGDRVRFYEINPAVVGLSDGPERYFTFLQDCAGMVTMVLGDARISLERELTIAPNRFDLLAIDAFSGDAIPVHLVTEEAFRLYAAHLRDDRSIIAVNITNRFLDLEPVIAAQAERLGYHAVRMESAGDPPMPQPSTWILMARDRHALESPVIEAGKPAPLSERRVHFTDRYSNLFRVLK